MSEPEKTDIQKESRRLVRLDLVDEKLQLLADKGILLMGGVMQEGSSNMLFLSMSVLRMAHPDRPISIVLKSEGGYVEEGLAMIDTIRAFRLKGSQVDILGVGLIASMAVGVMQAASRRYALPSTQFMVHEVSHIVVAEEKASESEDRTVEIKRINNIVMGIISEGSGVDKDQLMRDVRKKDLWMDAKAAKNFGTRGLIDEVVETYPFDI